MSYTPKTEAQIRAEMVWPEGEYDFEVTDCANIYSKKRNKMLAIILRVFNPKGQTVRVKDWLVESDEPLPQMKLRHYCRAIGAMEAYESGTIDNYPGVGATGKLKLGVEDDPNYGPQNRVIDYIDAADPSESQEVPSQQPEAVVTDDEIPF